MTNKYLEKIASFPGSFVKRLGTSVWQGAKAVGRDFTGSIKDVTGGRQFKNVYAKNFMTEAERNAPGASKTLEQLNPNATTLIRKLHEQNPDLAKLTRVDGELTRDPRMTTLHQQIKDAKQTTFNSKLKLTGYAGAATLGALKAKQKFDEHGQAQQDASQYQGYYQ